MIILAAAAAVFIQVDTLLLILRGRPWAETLFQRKFSFSDSWVSAAALCNHRNRGRLRNQGRMHQKAISEGLVSSKLKAVPAPSSQMTLTSNGTGLAPSIGTQQCRQRLGAAGEKRCKGGEVQPQKPAGSVLELLQGSGTKTRGSHSAPGTGPEEGPLAAEIHNPMEAAVTAKVYSINVLNEMPSQGCTNISINISMLESLVYGQSEAVNLAAVTISPPQGS
ncbi:hypothetical protein NDU88_004738 [Pleurodeles waltl]|uniref:Uncharacterized protein n=1 Tax=Pleurodeles waltl TaxID=8319 RepID=A0AAV7L0R0_PLEWA|nr:hypothetical protein NDU88_004738 [Pleurodeles waltl]